MSLVVKPEVLEAIPIRMQDLSPEYAEIMVLGNVLQKSGYFRDVRDQAQAVTKILFGRELGFSPIVSMGGIHIIEGKPALSSNLMATLIKRSGKYDYRVKTWTHMECVLTFREKTNGTFEDVGESSFTMDDAKTAGIRRESGSWAKYPKAMLFARALSQGLRTYCPDVSAAPIYNPEEMGAEVDEEGGVTQLPKSARPVEVTTEDIPLKSAPANLSQGAQPGTPQETSPQGADTHSTAGETTDHSGMAVSRSEAGPVSAVEYIDINRQKNIHKEWRAAVRKDFDGDKDFPFYDWLLSQGYKDDDGVPTAGRIPLAVFDTVKKQALAKARSL